MRDHSLKHVAGFVLLFAALFAALFAGAIQVHSHSLMRHATAQAAPAPDQPARP